MTALRYRSTGLLVGARRWAETDATGPLTLRATDDGWSLTDSCGDLFFRALGAGARRECLEFARDHGVCVVLS